MTRVQQQVNDMAQELATERQRREQSERMLDLAGAQNWGIDNLKRLDELQQQLLSALATIEKHNKRAQWPNCYKIKVDLSALREHDEKITAEACKPLVDLLKEAQHKLNPDLTKRIADALAKIK